MISAVIQVKEVEDAEMRMRAAVLEEFGPLLPEWGWGRALPHWRRRLSGVMGLRLVNARLPLKLGHCWSS
jgi:hypothetical protein